MTFHPNSLQAAMWHGWTRHISTQPEPRPPQPPQPPKRRFGSQVLLFCVTFLSKPLTGAMESHGERAGAAARRRGRRLRAWHRHVRTTVAMERPSTTARSGWRCLERERSVSSTTACGHRSDLSRGRGQHRCWRCCRRWGHSGTPWTRSSTPFLGYRCSMVPVPLMVEQLVDVLHLFDALIPVAEQVIDVPKIFIERIPPRTSVREPQLAEQLVEVPTIVSFSSLQRIMEHNVDIPVSVPSVCLAATAWRQGRVDRRKE